MTLLGSVTKFFSRYQDPLDEGQIPMDVKITDDMKGLHMKGKAVLKYLDILPKRISSRKPKKG